MTCFLVLRHVLEHFIESKPLISEECMLVHKVSNFYINILTMLIRNRTLLQVSQVYDKILFFKKTLNELFSFQGSGILTTYMYYQKFEEEERSFLWLCLYMILAKEEEASLSGASAILKPNHPPKSLSKS